MCTFYKYSLFQLLCYPILTICLIACMFRIIQRLNPQIYFLFPDCSSMSEKRPASAPRSSALRQQQQQPGQRSAQRHASGPPTNKSAEVNTSQHRYATEQRESQVAHHETPRRQQDGNIDRLKKSSRAQTASPLTTLSSADINTRRRNNNNQQDYHSTKNAQEKGTKRTDAYPGSKMGPPYSVFSNSQSIHHIDEEEIEEVSVATEPCSSV